MLLDIGNVDVSRVNGVIGLMLLDAANYYLVLKQEGPETVGSTDIITILHLLLPTFSITFGLWLLAGAIADNSNECYL